MDDQTGRNVGRVSTMIDLTPFCESTYYFMKPYSQLGGSFFNLRRILNPQPIHAPSPTLHCFYDGPAAVFSCALTPPSPPPDIAPRPSGACISQILPYFHRFPVVRWSMPTHTRNLWALWFVFSRGILTC